MQLKKITGKGKTGKLYLGQSEIFTKDRDGQMNLEFFAFDESKIPRSVTLEYFAEAVYGDIYPKIAEQLPSSIENYTPAKDEKGNLYLCFYQEGVIFGFDKVGNKFLEWEADEIAQGHAIHDIAYQTPGLMWLAFPTEQTVTQVSLPGRKEVYRIGEYSWEEETEPLDYPESVFIKGDSLFIPNMGNNKLFKVNLQTKEMSLISTFPVRIW